MVQNFILYFTKTFYFNKKKKLFFFSILKFFLIAKNLLSDLNSIRLCGSRRINQVLSRRFQRHKRLTLVESMASSIAISAYLFTYGPNQIFEATSSNGTTFRTSQHEVASKTFEGNVAHRMLLFHLNSVTLL